MRDETRLDGLAERPHRTVDAGRPAADREVPIEGTRRNSEFWSNFEELLRDRRQQRAPAGFAARVMAAILTELPA